MLIPTIIFAIILYIYLVHSKKNTQSEKMEHKEAVLEKPIGRSEKIQVNDYGQELGFIGLFLGGLIGYLLRPDVPLYGQLPFDVVITRGETLKGLDQIFIPVAQTSFSYMITGVILGVVIGWVVGKFMKKNHTN